jgi:hypothetical protein
MALGYVAALRNRQLDGITTEVGASGLLRIYGGGSGRPATGVAISDQTLLAELTLNATFAPAASGGVLTLNAITADSSANSTGTASWFRILTSGAVAKIDGNVGTSGSDLNLNSTSITSGGTVSVTSFTITAGNP